MTNLNVITIKHTYALDCFGDDLTALLENFLYELVRMYLRKPFWLTKKVKIVEFLNTGMHLTCNVYGEFYKDYGSVHNDAPKVKSLKFALMRICEDPEHNRHELFVTIDPTVPEKRILRV